MHAEHKQLSAIVRGGAIFIARAVQTALISLQGRSHPSIYGFREATHPAFEEDPYTAKSLLMPDLWWDVRPPDRHPTVRSWRLWTPTQPERLIFRSVDPPLLAEEFVDKLMPGSRFLSPNNPDYDRPIAKCPAVVVLDDLDSWFRKSFRLPAAGEDSAILADATETLRKYQKWITTRPVKLAASSPVRILDTLRAARTLLFARLRNAAESQQARSTPPSLEPVIICSVMEANFPQLDGGKTARADTTSFWEVLYDYKWLRDRTVVLLDANDIREVSHAMGISSEHSWEKTAQDTINCMQVSPQLRCFLEFGHVIVRFGVTGALVFSRRSNGDIATTLFFDPTHDDHTWTRRKRDGHVLGYSAVLAASIVKSLTRICSRRQGTPLLSDLAEAIDQSMHDSIVRLQYMCLNGYGRSHQDLEDLANRNWLPMGLFDDAHPCELDLSYSASSFEEQSFEDQPGDLKAETGAYWRRSIVRHVQRVEVPAVTLPNWSILRQSSQSRVMELAQRIALFGVNVAINQPRLSRSAILSRLTHEIGNEFYEHLVFPIFERPNATSIANMIISRAIENVTKSSALFGNRAREVRRECMSDLINVEFKKVLTAAIATRAKTLLSSSTKWGIFDFDRLEAKAAALREKLENDVDQIVTPIVNGPPPFGRDSEPVVAPIVRIGERQLDSKADRRFVIIDRREIEGITAIQRLFKQHFELVRVQKTQRPLSIAVFGPPGAGKSSTVKGIIRGLGENNVRELGCNLSQLTTFEDLGRQFSLIKDTLAEKEIPVMFFDEFDSKFKGDELGWLKFFLAPMEDGKVGDVSISDAIFVFAGGTSSTFADFNRAHRSPTDEEWRRFSLAKGPDFVSRLSKPALDIVGINPADADDELFLLRRAVVIRSLLEENGIQSKDIDLDVLRAILKVADYKYGVRTLRMLLEACTDEEKRITKSSVPPQASIDMLVHGKSFFESLMSSVTG